MLATGAFTLALGFMAARGILGITTMGLIPWVVTVIVMMPILLFAVGPAFVLHEIGHKLVAKHYGCWAEFRADPEGLKFGVGLAFVLGFLFMAPGAVMVAGNVTRKQNGHIAAAGPLVNLGLFLIGLPLGALLLVLSGATGAEGNIIENEALNWKVLLLIGIQYWLVANLILGAFNMIPFGPLDGLKVKAWSPTAFWILLGVFVIPLFCWWILQLWSPMMIVEYIANLF